MIRQLTAEKSWFIEWTNQWSQLLEPQNWYDMDLIWIRLENDKIMGGVEATFIILGLGFRWRWNHCTTPAMQDCLDAVEEISAGTAKTTERSCTDTIKEIEAGLVKTSVLKEGEFYE